MAALGEGELGLHLTQRGHGAEAYLHAKLHLDPSNHLDTVQQRYRQIDKQTDKQDRQRSDSIGRTVLQTVAQNGSPYAIRPLSVLSCLSVTLVYCGQTVVWIKILLGMEVGLCPGNIVVDGDPAPPMERGTVCLCSFRHFLLSVWA